MDTLFDSNLSIEEWISFNLNQGLSFFSPKHNSDYISCPIFFLNINLEDIQELEDVTLSNTINYKLIEIPAIYDYSSRSITTWKQFYLSNESLQKVILIEACFRDFLYENPKDGIWEDYDKQSELIKNVLPLIYTKKYCSKNILLNEAFEVYLNTFCSTWLKYALKNLKDIEPEEITNFIKSGKTGLSGETFEFFELVLSKIPVYLPDNPAYHRTSRYKSLLEVVKISLAYNIYAKSIVNFDENDKNLKREFQFKYDFLLREFGNKNPSEFYDSILNSFLNW